MTNEKAQNISKEILKSLKIEPNDIDYPLWNNLLIGYVKNKLVKSLKRELTTDNGDPANLEQMQKIAKFHQLNTVVMFGIKRLPDKKMIATFAPYGITEYDYILGKNLGESIRNAVMGVTEVSNKGSLIN